MTLRELERQYPSALARGLTTEMLTSVPTKSRDKQKLLSYQVEQIYVPLSHEGCSVELEFWTVLGSEALVFTGPLEWLPGQVPWFCRHDQDLCDLLIYRMEEMWGTANFNSGDSAESLNEMCARIPRVPKPPCIAAPIPADSNEGFTSDLQLV
jgi:hypothetical protein